MTGKRWAPVLQSCRERLLQPGPLHGVSPSGTSPATSPAPGAPLCQEPAPARPSLGITAPLRIPCSVGAPQGCGASKPTTPLHYFYNSSDYLLRFRQVSILVHFHSNVFNLVICTENQSGYHIPIWNLALVTANLKIKKRFWIFQLHFAFDRALGMAAAHSELPSSLILQYPNIIFGIKSFSRLCQT